MSPVFLYFSDLLSLLEKHVLEPASQISGKSMDSVQGHGMKQSDSEKAAIFLFLHKGSLGKEFFMIS